MKYFRINDSFEYKDRWYLRAPKTQAGEDVDPRLFTQGARYLGDKLLHIQIKQGTRALDFTLGSFDMPVLRTEIAELLFKLSPDEIQLIPVTVDGSGSYRVVNILRIVAAVNEALSKITFWTEADGAPQKTGTYFGIRKLVLNRGELNGAKLLRLKNWELPLIVCETIKQALEARSTSGINFEELEVE